jgi:small subunit ribosomal protein S19
MTESVITKKRKPPYISEGLVKAIKKAKAQGKKTVTTRSRSSTILPQMIGLIIMVHNGKVFNPVRILEDLVGKKLGEFSPTRTFKGHAGAKKR